MATTFRLELKSKPTKAGKYCVFLRITQDRKLKRVKTSVELDSKKDWNPKKQEVRSSEPNAASWNEALAKELEEAKATFRSLKEEGAATSDKIKQTIQGDGRTKSFLQYAKQRTQDIYDAGSIANWKKYNGFCNKLEAFLTNKQGKVKDLSFAELTPSFMAKFEAYLHSLKNSRFKEEKQLHLNTIHEQFKIFKALVHRAIKVEGLLSADKDPFLNFKSKPIATHKEKLTQEELAALVSLELEEGSLLWHTRNTFFFSLYCAGIRVGDLLQLRWCNITTDGRLNYQMGKNHKTRDLVLVDEAKTILKGYMKNKAKPTDYIFPFLDNKAAWAKAVTQEEKDILPSKVKHALLVAVSAKEALLNKYLKELAKRANIEKNITNHISRHSFAKMAKEAGVDNLMVKDMLAHSKLQITEGYMGSFASTATDEALKSIFSSHKQPSGAMDTATLVEALKGLNPDQLAAIMKQVKG